MKRGTLWIIGITAAIVTLTGLHAAVGSRYRIHNGIYNHPMCMHDNKNREENKATSFTEPTSNSTKKR